MANFWTSPNRDPKRAYRFTINISSFEGGATWYAKSATKPTFTVNTTEHKYINHTFHYPGSVTWEPVRREREPFRLQGFHLLWPVFPALFC